MEAKTTPFESYTQVLEATGKNPFVAKLLAHIEKTPNSTPPSRFYIRESSLGELYWDLNPELVIRVRWDNLANNSYNAMLRVNQDFSEVYPDDKVETLNVPEFASALMKRYQRAKDFERHVGPVASVLKWPPSYKYAVVDEYVTVYFTASDEATIYSWMSGKRAATTSVKTTFSDSVAACIVADYIEDKMSRKPKE